ncbi:hypothetical protein ACHWQZ_G005401 [Mnemiopsis leidyi]
MNSISDECTPLKHDYDLCFNSWYSEKFLKGIPSTECEELFKTYQTCVKKALVERGLEIPDFSPTKEENNGTDGQDA